MNRAFTYILTLGLLMIGGGVMGQRDNVQPQQGGQATNTSHGVIVNGDVFGGGNLAAVAGASSVTISQSENGGANIKGNVYGGGAFANTGSTTINITNGTIGTTGSNDPDKGNVYGGGLGGGTNPNNNQPYAPTVGAVMVNIGSGVATTEAGGATNLSGSARILGSVFGCNNTAGTPKGDVNINVFKMDHYNSQVQVGENFVTVSNSYPDGVDELDELEELTANFSTEAYSKRFALKAVYGGGNKASYVPETVNNKITVNIYGCEENTIQTVYGGGNAADVGVMEHIDPENPDNNTELFSVNTNLNVYGGFIDQVFGGGNGKGDENPGANISGTATTRVEGGLYRQVFGGSNSKGDVRATALTIDKVCDDLLIHESFGGANEANITGDVTTNLACSDVQIGSFYGGSNLANINGSVTLNVYGGIYSNVFGGSKGRNAADPLGEKAADIDGNVTLNLYGGNITNAFGGSNVNGNITGKITVNINDIGNASCPLKVTNVYGAGNLTAYTPNDESKSNSPSVYVKNVKSNSEAIEPYNKIMGDVFGGAKGSLNATATVYSNPLVVVGDSTFTSQNIASVNHSVYGGGDLAPVVGSTTVLVQKSSAPNENYGTVILQSVYGGGNKAYVTGSTIVNVTGGTVTQDVYGGGALANVNGNETQATSGTTTIVAVSGGSVRDVYGGGLGSNESGNEVAAKVFGPVTVTIDAGTVQNVYGCNNANGAPQSNVTVNINSNVANSVYGGGNLAEYQAPTATTERPNNPMVNINNGTMLNVFGGGNGDEEDTTGETAKVTGNPLVTIGDSNDGHKTNVTNVYGGGNAANVSGNTKVIYNDNNNQSTLASLYGGGNAAGVSGTTTVEMSLGQVTTGVYGGCNTKGTVGGASTVSINGGTIGTGSNRANVYGGGLGSPTVVSGSVNVTITGSIVNGDVYGGSAQGKVNCTYSGTEPGYTGGNVNTHVTLQGGTVNGDIYGGGYGIDAALADVWGPVIVDINNGTIGTYNSGANGGNVFGCNNAAGAPKNSVVVNINNNVTKNVYGGGNLAAYTYTTGNYPEVNIKKGEMENVFGGGLGADAIVTANPKVTIGDNTNSSTYVKVTGNVYGGGDAAKVVGNTTVAYNDSHASSQVANIFGGSNAANIEVNPSISGTGKTNVTLTSGKVTSALYGGCNSSGTVQGDITVALNGGTVGENGSTTDVVYGGGQGHSTATGGDIAVTLNGTTVYGNLYGGSALGSVNAAGKTTTVTLATATLNGKVFGGGMGSGTETSTQATTLGNATVNINVANTDGKLTGIYGGANVNGDVAGDINVYVNANVGSSGNNNKRDIYGGGLGANTTTGGNVTVTIGDQAGTYQPVVYGDVYGGSQLGSVNDAAGDKTKVDFLNGTLHGNIYGGGLGDANDSSKGWVNGEVIVNVGSSTQTAENCHIDLRGCNVYGCNNTNGSPQADVTVNIYKTSHTTTNAASYTTNTGSGAPTFAIDNVFGGGNKASYSPENGASNSTKKTNVIIHDCSNTIEDVFGGGDAAEVYKTYVQVEGGRFDRVFAGGNGEVTAANIGVGGTSLLVQAGIIHQLFGGSNEKGTISGPISVTLNHDNENCPEEITEFFGGSNLAAIGTNDSPATLNTTIACGVGTITEVYGGSNAADIIGNVTLNIEGGTITNAYGGSKGRLASDEGGAMPADILDVTNGNGSYGNVTLNLFGGTIDNAFGGSNKNGDIDSKITVNMLDREATNCGLTVHNIFGASNLAAYGPNSSSLVSPEVNLIHGTVSKKSDNTGGNVFGGGKGSTAAVTANPKVTIGYDATAMSTLVTGLLPTGVSLAKSEVEVKGNVYGGGDEASVTGATIVKMLEEETDNTLTSTSSDVNGDIYGGGNKATVSGNTTVTIEGGTVTNDVYGGGAFADVGTVEVLGQNSTPATEHIVTITGGELNGNVYGGGLGGVVGDQTFEPKVNGTVTVNIGTGTVAGGVANSVVGDVVFAANSSVYGCNNAKGSPQDDVTVNIFKTHHTEGQNSNAFAGTGYAIKQVFGGGRNAHYAPQNGNENSTKRAHVNVYTCDNTIEDVFGGGDAANAVGVETLIKGGRFNRIFGGGNGAGQNNPGANIGSGGVTLTINGGQIGSFFGGSNELGSISGPLNVTVQQQAPCGLDINDFFCGSNMVDITGDVNTTIECGASATNFHINNLYGGSNLADITGNVSLTVKGGDYTNVFGGSKGRLAAPGVTESAANINGNVTLNLYGGTMDNAYGGSRDLGNITGAITVNLLDKGGSCALVVHNIYGGGYNAEYTPDNSTGAYPEINLIHGSVTKSGTNTTDGNVYGGGYGSTAIVHSNPKVVVGSTTLPVGETSLPNNTNVSVAGNVFGGGEEAAVDGTTNVTIQQTYSTVAGLYGGGNMANVNAANVNVLGGKVTAGVYGGCNTTGTVSGNITVDLAGGQVGTNTTNADVYGGGFGGGDNGTFTTGNVTVTLRDNAVVWGDLYGGSAFGSVNGNTNSKTTVNLQNDKIHGKVFGGGKGQLGTSTLTEYTAVTNGNVELNLTAANTNGNLTGIYGGANVKGNVAGDINVYVNANVGSSSNNIKRDIYGGGLGANTTTGGNVTVTIGDQAGTYLPVVCGDVYGGSQLGSVNDASGDKTTVNFLNGTLHGNIYGGGLGDADDSSMGQVNGEVVVNVSNNSQSTDNCHIDLTDAKVYGCNNTNGSPQDNVTVNIYRTSHNETNAAGYTGGSPTYSIKKVFGGGNHASYNPTGTQKTSVVIYGCDNTIEDVFGGGDAASVKKTSLEVNGGRFNRVFAGGNGENGQADIGTGGTSLLVKAGKIHQLFGGSNKNGTINGPITVNLNHENSTCTEKIDEFFGGSNEAAIGTNANPATLNTTIACGVGEITDIYGGSNAASIIGNVTLNIYGGKITNAYGGSKGVSGGTAADIKDARNSSNQPLGTHGKVTLNLYGGEITNAFGGSNFNGNIENKITVNMSDSEVTSCGLIVHNIYGGSNLTPYTPNSSSLASPEVNLIHGTVSKSGENYGDVFGGGKGNTAVVTANPKVTIGDNDGSHKVIVQSNVYGGGDAAKVVGNTTVEYNDNHTNSTVANIFGGGNAASVEKTNTSADNGKTAVTMTSGKVTSNVYGGCNSQGTVQNTTTVKVKGGEVQGSVFGGGKGEDTVVTGQAIVRIIAPSTIGGDVFGGGDEGKVNGGTDVKVMATDNE